MAAGGSSHSLEARYAHVPGLVVDCPSTSADEKGLLEVAVRCDDPVVCMEHKGLWGIEDDVPDDPDLTVPFGEARTVREGVDVTIVSWSGNIHVAAEAAGMLAGYGIGVGYLGALAINLVVVAAVSWFSIGLLAP